MKKVFKKNVLAFASVLLLVPALVAGMLQVSAGGNAFSSIGPVEVSGAGTVETAPKYIFMFVGDGMSYPQIQATSYYLGAVQSGGGVENAELSFMNFPAAGSASTYDSTSFAPDSASTATSFASGRKTYSGTINMDTSKTIKFETIAEKLKSQMDYKIGIVTSVNLNHATPAAYYAHQASRSSYYDIGLEMIESGFEYFAGGALLKPTDGDTKTDLYELAEESGYVVAKTQAEAENLTSADDKVIIIAETLADSDAMSYEMDAENGEWLLADYVEKGIEVLEGEEGFFMMVEGGKIDWACHANDAAATIHDVIAFDNAVQVAIDFYNRHPEETLIIVTGDHETGGLSIGFAGTDYDTYLTNLTNQKISYAKYDADFVEAYKANGTSFEDVLKDIKTYFGLMTENDPDATEDSKLVLTAYEYGKLRAAYEKTMSGDLDDLDQEEYLLYGTYEPLSVTITHILNNKSGIAFTSYAHTGVAVPVFAKGTGADYFNGYYDNTDIFHKLASITNVK